MEHSQRKINAELTKMMDAYEALIKAPKTNIKKWADYGTYGGCRVCKLFKQDADFGVWGTALLCAGCPIGVEGEYTGCARRDNDTCHLLQEAILAAISVQNDLWLKKREPKQWAAKMDEAILDVQIMAVERMDFLELRLGKNGYQYK